MTNEPLKVGIAGKRGLAMLAGLRAQPGVEVVALCDRDEATLEGEAAQHDIPRRFTRYEEMIGEVDAVVVATPMPHHVPHAVLALNAGKHVLSEVPAAVSLGECWRLLDAAQASGVTYMMAENYCYTRENVLVRELVRNGLFGEVYYGEGEYLHEIRDYHHTAEGGRTWRYYWQVGVNGNTYPTHSLGPPMQWFAAADPTDRLESVICVGTGRRSDPEHPHDDTSLMLCRMVSGKLIKVRLDMMSARPHLTSYYALQGTCGAYEASRAEGEPGRIWLGENRAGESRAWRPLTDYMEQLPEAWRNPPPEALAAGHGGGDYYEVRDFVEAIRSGAPPPVDIYAALEWTAAGLCSQTSIENGGVSIRVPNFRDPAQRPVMLDAPPVEL